MNHTAVLEKTTAEKQRGAEVTASVRLEVDIVVLGHLACWASHAGSSEKRPCRGWGDDMRRNSLPVGNDIWVGVNKQSNDVPAAREIWGNGTLGILFTRIVNAKNGGNERETYWFPMSAFESVRALIEGVRV